MKYAIAVITSVAVLAALSGVAGAATIGSAYDTAVMNGGGSGFAPEVYFGLDESGTGPFSNRITLPALTGTNFGTPTSSTNVAFPQFGTSVDFDRSNTKEAIYLGNPVASGNSLSTTAIVWFNPDQVTTIRNIFMKASNTQSSTYMQWKMDVKSGLLRIVPVDYSTSPPQTTAVTAGAWHMAAFAWNHVTMKQDFYLDPVGGAAYATRTAVLGLYHDTEPLYIGSEQVNANSFEGLIDEVAVWDEYLTGAQIQAIFDAATIDVPEPATMSLLALGAVGMLVRRRRTR